MENAILSSVNQHFEDHDGLASYKSLSIAFGWSLEESQRNLEIYLTKHPHLKPVFYVSGFHSISNNEWEYVVRLTASVDAECDRDLINPIRHIHSIHKNETLNPYALACFDMSLDQNLIAHPELVSFPWKPCKRMMPAAKPQQEAPPKPSPVKETLVSPIAASTTKPPTVTPLVSVRTAAPVAKRQSLKRGPKSSVQSNLKFNAKKSEPSSKAPVEPEPIPDPFADSEEEEEEDDLSEDLHVKRRRIVFSSDEEEEGQGRKKLENKKPTMEVSKNKGRKASTAASSSISKVHRVTKKPDKDVTLSNVEKMQTSPKDMDKDEEAFILSPATGVKSNQSPGVDCSNNTRRQQVTKTFMDEDGYLITERLWEDVSIKETEKVALPKPVSGASAKIKENSKPKKAKQATLTSFFKK